MKDNLALAIILFSLLFSVSDLIGQEKAERLERRLLFKAEIGGWRCALFFAGLLSIILKLLPLLLLFSVFVVAELGSSYIYDRYVAEESFFRILYVGAYLVLLRLSLESSVYFFYGYHAAVEKSRFFSGWQKKLANFLKEIMDTAAFQEPENHLLSFALGKHKTRTILYAPVVIFVAFSSYFSEAVYRAFYAIFFGFFWLALGAPVVLLKAAAKYFGNPSYFNLGKYVLLLAGLGVFIAYDILA